MDSLLCLLTQELHCQMSDPKYMKEDSPPWHTGCVLARDGRPQEAESLYRLKKQLEKFAEEKKTHRGQLNTKTPPLVQVTELQIAGGWKTAMGECFTTCFSCSYSLPTTYFAHCWVQNMWLDGHLIWHSMALLRSFISSVHTIELALQNFSYWTSNTYCT